jgi:hypothetical protein
MPSPIYSPNLLLQVAAHQNVLQDDARRPGILPPLIFPSPRPTTAPFPSPIPPTLPTPTTRAILIRHQPSHFLLRAGPPRLYILPNDLPAQILKHLIDIRASARRRLVVGHTAPRLGDLEGAGARDGAVVFQVGLVADQHDGHGLGVFNAHDLVAQGVQFVQAVERGDGEDEKEALAGFHVEFAVGWVG